MKAPGAIFFGFASALAIEGVVLLLALAVRWVW